MIRTEDFEVGVMFGFLVGYGFCALMNWFRRGIDRRTASRPRPIGDPPTERTTSDISRLRQAERNYNELMNKGDRHERSNR